MLVEPTKLLTQFEVDELSEGIQVYITWSGGNGPHLYTIQKRGGYSYAGTAWDIEHSYLHNPITFVGQYPLTQVWRKDAS